MSKAYNFEQLRPLIEESTNAGASFPLKITGNSMYPTLRHKESIVYIEKARAENLKKGDVVFVCARGVPTLHRIKKITENGFYMVGDNQIVCDFVSFDDDIIGVVYRYSKRSGDKAFPINTPFIRFKVALHRLKLKAGKLIKKNK